MRGSLFGLRSGTNSVTNSPVQTPTGTPLLQQQQPSHRLHDDIVEPLSLPPPVSSGIPAVPVAPRSRPLNRLGLTPFRKATHSPVPSNTAPATNTPIPSSTPVLTPSPTPAPVNVSYLDSLGLKLGEAVSKALVLPSSTHATAAKPAYMTGAGVSSGGVKAGHAVDGSDAILNGKRPLPAGRGRALGTMIASEINHATTVLHDPFLHRAILRLLQKPLTVLNTTLTQQVTHLILAPEFAPPVPLTNFNPTQAHALALAHFASELLETFDALTLGRAPQRGGQASASDQLRAIREGLENVVTRVVGPFVAAIKSELGAVIVEVEKSSEAVGRLDRAMTRVAPLLARATFAGESAQSTHVQSILATLEIGAIWASLVSLANRALPRQSPKGRPTPVTSDSLLRRTVSEGKLRTQPSDGALSTSSGSSGGDSCPPDYAKLLPSYITPPDTPQVAPVTTEKEPRRLSSGISLAAAVNGFKLTSSPPPSSSSLSPRQITPPSTKKMSLVKLPSLKPLARAPSPPVKVAISSPQSPSRTSPVHQPADDALLPTVVALHALARDAHIVHRAIMHLPLPVEGGLARDAVDEAFKEMVGFVEVLDHLALSHPAIFSLFSGSGRGDAMDKLMDKTRETPMLLVLPVLLRMTLATSPSSLDTVSGWIGLSDQEIRRTCLCGFAKAEECAPIVGKALLKNAHIGRAGVLPAGFKAWLERSVQEEEEDSSSSSEDEA